MAKKPAPPSNHMAGLDPKVFKNLAKGIDRGLAFVIYSDPGIGKTHLAGTLPEYETLVINTDAGVGPLVGRNFALCTLDDSLDKLDFIYKFLRTEKHPFKYVVIDNLSELQRRMVNILTEGRKKDFPELSEYGNTAYKMREYIRLFRDLVELNITIVFNCWEANIQLKNAGGEVVRKTGPDVYESVVQELCGIVDAVGHLELYEKTGDRFVRFSPIKNMIAKCQFKGLDDCEPADFPTIIEKIESFDYTPVSVPAAVSAAVQQIKGVDSDGK